MTGIFHTPNGEIQRAQTHISAVQSASVGSGAWAPISGVSVTLNNLRPTSLVRIDVHLALGAASAVRIWLRAMADAPFLTGNALGVRRTGLGGRYIASTSDIESIGFSLYETGHGGGSQTYTIEWGHEGAGAQTLYLNRSGTDSDLARNLRAASWLAAAELPA